MGYGGCGQENSANMAWSESAAAVSRTSNAKAHKLALRSVLAVVAASTALLFSFMLPCCQGVKHHEIHCFSAMPSTRNTSGFVFVVCLCVCVSVMPLSNNMQKAP